MGGSCPHPPLTHPAPLSHCVNAYSQHEHDRCVTISLQLRPPPPQHTLVSGPRARHANVVPKLQEAKHEEVFDIKEGYLVSDCNAWSGWQCA